jgi:hypothetical protein
MRAAAREAADHGLLVARVGAKLFAKAPSRARAELAARNSFAQLLQARAEISVLL